MISIIGYGNHVRKNIIPALDRANIKIDSIITKGDVNKEVDGIKLYNDIKQIGSLIVGDIVYIATPISTHYELVIAALNSGKHVICEKPLVENIKHLENVYCLAEKKGVLVYQVEMYKYHKQYLSIKTLIEENDLGQIKFISADFRIPHLNKTDIRYSPLLSGGALMDVGFYPLSFMTSFLDMDEYKHVYSTNQSAHGYHVDLNGMAVWKSNECIATASWAIGSAYKNSVTIEFEKGRMEIERAFSKPHNYESIIKVEINGSIKKEYTFEDDHFVNMFNAIIDGQIDFAQHMEDTKNVVLLMERVRNS